MRSTIAAWDASAWSAAGVWITVAVYLALAVVGVRQLREARRLRIQQHRPYMVADMSSRSIIVFLRFRNDGQSAARNVRFVLRARANRRLVAG